ncbi:unnamed protein product [Cunninghamella echinulata]
MASQLFKQSLRTITRTTVSKPLMVRSMNAALRPSIIKPTLYRSFSVAMPRMSAGEVNSDLVHKLNEELSYEKENEEFSQPAFIKEF